MGNHEPWERQYSKSSGEAPPHQARRRLDYNHADTGRRLCRESQQGGPYDAEGQDSPASRAADSGHGGLSEESLRADYDSWFDKPRGRWYAIKAHKLVYPYLSHPVAVSLQSVPPDAGTELVQWENSVVIQDCVQTTHSFEVGPEASEGSAAGTRTASSMRSHAAKGLGSGRHAQA